MASPEPRVSSEQEAADALAQPPRTAETSAAEEARDVPRLARGTELIGEFEDSGFKQAPYIARRSDGQVVQLPQMLYKLAEQIDGRADGEELARRFTTAIERQVEAGDVHMLIEEQLRPLGIVAPRGGEPEPELNKVDPLLALKFRAAVVPDRAVRSLTTVFRPLFLPPVVIVAVLGLLGVDGWLFFVHGVSQSLRHTLYQPLLLLMLIGSVILATAFHEIGHATACRYGGAEPGVMGVGIYIVWPAFYTDITDAYRLSKWGRLRTDLGGMYFNVLFALLVTGLYAVTGLEALLLLVVLQNFAILQQSMPFLRLDGYYVLSDLAGVPDIFMRIRPVLASFIPGRKPDERVTELKSWVRAVVSGYVVLVVGFFGLMLLFTVINLPRMVATGYDSAALHFQAIGPDFNHAKTAQGIVDLVQTIFLVLPGAGLVYTAVRMGRSSAKGALSWSSGEPARQAALGLAGAGALALAAFSWWPNGEYRPIQPSERGTLAGAFRQLGALPTGRPSLTQQRAKQLGGAPTERSLRRSQGQAPASRSPNPARPSVKGRGPGTTDPNSTPPAGTITTPQTTTPDGGQAPGTPPPSSSTQTTPQSAPPPPSGSPPPQSAPPPSGSPSGTPQSTPPPTTGSPPP